MSSTTMKDIKKPILHVSCVPRKDTTLLKISLSQDDMGILFRVTSVLFNHGWDILEAVAETSHDGRVQDLFVIRSWTGDEMTEGLLAKIRKDLFSLFYESKPVEAYLRENGKEDVMTRKVGDPEAALKLYNPISSDFTVMDLRMRDTPGILFQITEALFHLGIDIISFTANSTDGKIRDSFLLRTSLTGDKLDEKTMFPLLRSRLESFL
jgi:UTP:GlnB (protein PII) uridylyltransferase